MTALSTCWRARHEYHFGLRCSPVLKILRVEDFPAVEVKAQQHGDVRVGVHLRFLEQTPTRTFIHCHYDPGMIIEEHGHVSDHAIYILNGSVMIGDEDCRAGTLVILERGSVFGPLVAGPDGTDILEFYAGEPTPVPVDREAFAALLNERGIDELEPTFQTRTEP
jgi:hypothetical protein